MTYEEAMEFLYSQLPMFSRIGPAAYKNNLDNIIALSEHLGNPHLNFKSIHVAGTNGKGSTSHMLAAIFQECGYKTGLYTSPHIKDFGERIRINGEMIDREFVANFTQKMKSICLNVKPSFFEMTVVMAFEYFSVHKVDFAIIETGLGGRLDSTNIISPILSVITNIGYDHTNLLGETLTQIASEKAGIIKQNTPVVIGETLPETKTVFEKKANDINAEVHYAESYYQILESSPEKNQLRCKVYDSIHQKKEEYILDLPGKYQIKNLRTVLTATSVLNTLNYRISEVQIKSALSKVKKTTGLRGRWDVISRNPDVICDVGHNKDGITEILSHLEQYYPNSRPHFILGFVNDKDVSSVLELLPKNGKYYFTNSHIPRALPHQQLQIIAFEKNISGESFDDVNKAIHAALKNASKEDVIVVCGSFFIIAEVNESAFVEM